MHSNLVTKFKVTECNRMSLTIFMHKSMSQDEIKKSPSLLFNNVYVLLVPGHTPGISDECYGQAIWRSPGVVHSFCRVWNNVCPHFAEWHSSIFDSATLQEVLQHTCVQLFTSMGWIFMCGIWQKLQFSFAVQFPIAVATNFLLSSGNLYNFRSKHIPKSNSQPFKI